MKGSIPEQLRQVTDEIIREGKADFHNHLGRVNERLGEIEASLERIEQALETIRNGG